MKATIGKTMQAGRTHLWACAVVLVAALLACVFAYGTAWAKDSASDMVLTTAAGKTGLTTASSQPVPDGDYAIRSGLSYGKVADVAGGSKKENANVQLYEWNKTAAQRWHFKYDARGRYYTITCNNSGNALTATAKRSGANVCMRKPQNLVSQRWIVEKSGSRFIIRSAWDKNLVLDVSGASTRNGANIQVYKANGTKAQLFAIASYTVPASTATIEKGAYTISAMCSKGKVLDVSGASRGNGANVQQYAPNGTYAQRFWIEPAGKGYYRIFNIGSGLALDVSGASVKDGANVWQYGWNGTEAQLWSVSGNNSIGYTFTSVCSGKVLDVCGASSASGANVWQYSPNNTPAQRFKLNKTALLSPGYVTLAGAFSTGRVIDVPGATTKAGTQLQMYSANGTQAQKYLVAFEGSGNYSLRSCASGLYVAAAGNGAIVQQSGKYLWKVNYGTGNMARRGIMFEAATGKAAIYATGSGQSAKLRSEAPANKTSHMFLPGSTQLLNNGYYIIKSAAANKVLDIAGGSSKAGANVQVYQPNKTAAQVFYIEHAGNGNYTIVNAGSKKSVGVSGSDVRQLNKGTGADKLWFPEIAAGGSVTFRNAKTSSLLTATGTGNSANVNVKAAAGTAYQRWVLTPTSEPSNLSAVAQRALSKINGKGSSTSYMIAVDLSNHYVVVFRGSAGSWKFDRMFQCTNGAKSTPTVTGDFSIGSKGYSFDGPYQNYTCYYWTQFYGDYLFHSVIYKYHSWTVDVPDLGKAWSHGCVRLAIENAKWIQDHVPYGSHVYIYN